MATNNIEGRLDVCTDGNYDDVYCVEDYGDGTGRVVNVTTGEAVSGDLNIGGEVSLTATDIDDSGFDVVYVETAGKKLSFLTGQKAPSNWRDLPHLSVPYDVDVDWDDGCGGTDVLSQDEPFNIYVSSGALFIANNDSQFVVTPDLILAKSAWNYSYHSFVDEAVLNFRQRADDILDCAHTTAKDPKIRSMLEGACLMAKAAPLHLEDQIGPYRFGMIDRKYQYNKASIGISSHRSHSKDVSPFTTLSIKVDPEGFWGRANQLYHITINRAGLVYREACYGGFKEVPCTPVYDMGPIDPKRHSFIIDAVRALIDGSADIKPTDAEVRTLTKVIEVLQNYKTPGWVKK